MTARPRTHGRRSAGCGHEVGLMEACTILAVVGEVFGDVPVLGARVERDSIPVRVSSLPWPVRVRSVEVAVHCESGEDAAEVAARLGLNLQWVRRFGSEAAGLEFVESTWAGWLTSSEAASLDVPVSVTLLGAHLEPSPARRGAVGAVSCGEAAA